MMNDQFMKRLSFDKTYSRKELFSVFKDVNSDQRNSTFRWTLYNMLEEQQIFKTGYDSYTINQFHQLSSYRPSYSDQSKRIMNYLQRLYPDLEFVMFKSVQLNEFLNHQFAQNTIYVQVEKDVSSYIFDALREKYKCNTLYKPNGKAFERYWSKDCIVVLDLISQSPLSEQFSHEMTGEKMLVDIIAEKCISSTFSLSELPFIYENFKENYRIDKHRLNRYAGRRGKTAEVNKYLQAE